MLLLEERGAALPGYCQSSTVGLLSEEHGASVIWGARWQGYGWRNTSEIVFLGHSRDITGEVQQGGYIVYGVQCGEYIIGITHTAGLLLVEYSTE